MVGFRSGLLRCAVALGGLISLSACSPALAPSAPAVRPTPSPQLESPITFDEINSAVVPPMCHQSGGRLEDGRVPDEEWPDYEALSIAATEPAGGRGGPAFVTWADDSHRRFAAVVMDCAAGDLYDRAVVVFRSGPQVAGVVELAAVTSAYSGKLLEFSPVDGGAQLVFEDVSVSPGRVRVVRLDWDGKAGSAREL